MRPERRAKAGFSLLEALVAVAVVALLIVPTLESIVSSRATSRAASRELGARLLFDRLLASMPLGDPVEPGKRSGKDGSFTWEIEATPSAEGAATPDDQLAKALIPYAVRISLTAAQGSTLTLNTVRLGSPPAPEQ